MKLIRSALAHLFLAVLLCAPLFANDTPPASPPRYTFSWPLDGGGLMPRGGTTKGPAVTLDRSESPAWQRLQEKGLSDFERDRRAILAMAGTYRVTFDFLEVTPFGAQEAEGAVPVVGHGEGLRRQRHRAVHQPRAHSRDAHRAARRQGQRADGDEALAAGLGVRAYGDLVEYKGNDRWQRRQLASTEGFRRWRQTVYQVDESPRYASLGKWEHTGSFSTWLSCETWRPLPRREWSVRDDYQVLVGTNRHTILPTGWVQEENNLKAVVTQARELDSSRPYVGREYGVARYERIRDADFAAADSYYERTKEFWDQVRDRWSKVFAERGSVTLRGPVDKLGLFQPLFAHAEAIAEQGAPASKKNAEVIEAALKGMGAL